MTIKQQGGVFGRNPTFNNVDVEGNLDVGGTITHTGTQNITGQLNVDNLRLDGNTISSTNTNGNIDIAPNGSGRVGVGIAVPDGKFHVHSGSAGTVTASAAASTLVLESSGAAGMSILFDDTNLNAYGVFYMGNETDGSAAMRMEYFGSTYVDPAARNSLYFRTNGVAALRIDGSQNLDLKPGGGNLQLASGAGIDFSATSGTGTSELFDDYEEGTWTPTFSAEFTTPPTVTSTQYTKIGRQVTVTMLAVGGVVIAGGSIGGLPFASNAAQGAGAYGGNSDTTESLQGTVGQSASSITNIPARILTGDTWQITTTYFT